MSTKKYYTRAGEEVKMGDVLRRERRGDYFAIIQEFTVLPNSISKLIKKGLIVEREDPEKGPLKSEKDVEYYLRKICQKSSLNEENSMEFLFTLLNICPASLYTMFLREIAIDLDANYEDHISNSPDIYVVDIISMKVYNLRKGCIKDYKNLAAFRSVREAQIALGLLEELQNLLTQECFDFK
jgi:hypothetical protein